MKTAKAKASTALTRARTALQGYDSSPCGVIDLLTDLMHRAASRKINFSDQLADAERCFEAEQI